MLITNWSGTLQLDTYGTLYYIAFKLIFKLMKKLLSLVAICMSMTAFAQNLVSFSVDMNEYSGPAYSQVEVTGNFAGWCGGCIVMTETSPGSLIYTVDNVSIASGPIEYKFTADFFAIQENFFPGGSCTVTNGGFTNRSATISGDTDLGLVCWESCDPCGTVVETVDITFEVNMSSVPTAASGVFLAGGGNFGNPGDFPMTETAPGSDVWTITVTRPVGFSSFYTFTNGLCPDYSCKENLAGLPCGNPGNFNDRFLPAVNSNTTIQHCFGQCSTDGTCEIVTLSDVTFSVDMNAYAGTFSSVSVGGTWNGFNPLDFPMSETSPGSGVYETTISLADGIYEYKFIEDGGAGPDEYYETLTEGDICTVTNFGFTNRALTVAGNATLPTVCFEACGACPVLGCQAPSDLAVIEIGFGTATARVNGTWTNPEGTTSCEVRGGRISPASYTAGEPEFANPAQTQTITQTTGTTINFNVGLYNNPNIPFVVGQRYGYEVRCACSDGSGFSDWANITPAATFVVPAPPPAGRADGLSNLKSAGISSMNLFPNPAEDVLNVQIMLDSEGSAQFYLMNALGQNVMEQRLSGEAINAELNISNLEAGIYLLNVITDNGSITERVIIK